MLPAWLRLVLGVAVLKVGLGLFGLALGAPLAGARPERDLVYLAHVVVFAVCAAGLAFGARQDRRAPLLGLFFLLVASEFADRLLLRLGGPAPALARPLLGLGHLQVEAFLPYVLWRFVDRFPHLPPAAERGGRVPRAVFQVCFAAGAVLLAINLIHAAALLRGRHSAALDLLAPFGRYESGTIYHATLFVLMLPALGFLIWRSRRAEEIERRRVRVLLAGLVAGSTPMLVAVLLMSFWPAADAMLSGPRVFPWLELVVYAGTLAVPMATAYAVLVRHALDVRLVIRKAVRYALARYTLLAVTLAPLAALVLVLFLHRQEPLGRLLTGPRGAPLLVAGGLGLAMLGLRRRLLAGLDRRFFREQYHATRTLHALAEGSGAAEDAGALEDVLLREIDRALHLDTGALLVHVQKGDQLASPSGRCRPLAARSALARALAGRGEPVAVQLSPPDELTAPLPHEERQWLSDAGFRLLLPLPRPSGDLLGVLALGGKRSELPFTREDRMLLSTVALSARAALEERIRAVDAGPNDDADRSAVECPSCGTLAAAGERTCSRCPRDLQPAQVPLVLHGKFRLERRIGRGGMGVVYLATDLHLGRLVAVKTLPWVAPDLASRLRREARAMAAVSHPNLATIYGIEFFHGVPMLVVEYLAGGTLSDRLREDTMPWPEAIALGVTLADAVDRLHEAGILHRDIKPGNVGFSADGVPKLLDLGLARAIEAVRELERTGPHHAMPRLTREVMTAGDAGGDLSITGTVTGTLPYLSPEALRGRSPDPSFDLWGLAVVLFEAIAGTLPTAVRSPYEPGGTRPLDLEFDIVRYVPDCPTELAAFFHDALHADPRRRPASARALAERLRGLGRMASGEAIGAGPASS